MGHVKRPYTIQAEDGISLEKQSDYKEGKMALPDEGEDPFTKVDFNWEMLLGKPDHRCFGMTGRRKVYPVDPIHTKFGSVLNPIRGSPNLAPNKYDVDRITSMDYLSKNKLTSDKGYYLGARTGVRIAPMIVNQNPGPGHYGKNKKAVWEQQKKPFGTSAPRLPPIGLNNVPGPGTYSPKEAAVHGVELPQSFGGRSKHIIEKEQKPSFKPLNRDKELERQRRRLEYLNLYW